MEAIQTRNRDKPADVNRAASERWNQLQKLGEPTRPGSLLGYVRQGFLFHSLNTRNGAAAPVFFAASMGGSHFGTIRPEDFIWLGRNSWRKWWNPNPEKEGDDLPRKNMGFRPCTITEDTLLLDPFDATTVVLVNTTGTMQRAWAANPSPPIPPKPG